MLVISAPFGNYLNFHGCLRTRGTYTLYSRRGRLWRAILSLRYLWRQQGWINKLGLRNPGIDECPLSYDLVSVHGFTMPEWITLVDRCTSHLIELNLSCPNVDHRPDVSEVAPAIRKALSLNKTVVAKLPPVRWMAWARPLVDLGVTNFHLCNTIPTPGGGLSGKPLMQYSLWACEEVRAVYPDVTIIGGGGVSCVDDVRRYRSAGANSVAIGSMLLNPLNWRKVAALRSAAEEE